MKPPDIYKTRKYVLDRILPEKYKAKIQEAVIRTNKITIMVYLFLKFYYTKKYHNGDINSITLPKKSFVEKCIQFITRGESKTRAERPNKDANKEDKRLKRKKDSEEQNKDISSYYAEFVNLFPYNLSEYSKKNLSHITEYIEEEIVTSYTNNVQMNFIKYVKKLINIESKKIYYSELHWSSDKKLTKDERKQMFRCINKVKSDILELRDSDSYESDKIYHTYIYSFITSYLPSIENDSIYYDLLIAPDKYLSYMIKINLKLEEYEVRLYNPLCLRTDNIPKHIRIDTNALIDILFGSEEIEKYKKRYNVKINKDELFANPETLRKKYPSFSFNGTLHEYKTCMWLLVCTFSANKNSRKLLKHKDYVFDNQILTDGYSACIIQRNKTIPESDKKLKRKIGINDVSYLDDLDSNKLNELRRNTTIVCLDPGKKNIAYISGGYQDTKTLRYTYVQRRFESKAKYYKKKLVKNKKTFISSNQTIEEIENSLQYNSKSNRLDATIHYIKETLLFRKKVENFYCDIDLRHARYSTFKNTQKSEENFFDNIEKTFKLEKPITVVYGNWSCSKQMRNFAPTPGVRLRRRMAKRFNVYLIDEWGTSKTCSCCGGETDYINKLHYYERRNMIHTRVIHGLLRCQNENCSKLWNRDLNATINQKSIVESILNNLQRPLHLCRQ